jgi:two-component system phosphate regulon sensor histidine kinase PhoR
VTVARASNIALSAGILLLILAIVAVLLHSSRRSQQLAEIQMNFVAGVSHEPRTPLSVIRTAAYNLRGPLAGRPEQVARYAELIQKQSETLSVVVEQVLRYGTANSRRAASERGMVSIRQMLRSLVASATQAPGIDVETSFDPNLPMIPADELALKHALQNLVDNAIKYGTEGSQWVGISARAMVEGAKRQVEIRVADRGPGIPRDEQAHLFEAFFRGRRALQDQINGTGLGLNLVKKIVDAHGGTVRVNSEPGKGAEFIVRLPAAAEELEDVFSNPVD